MTDPLSSEPSTDLICQVVRQIKSGVDGAKARGVKCDYPILFEIDGYTYSFAICLRECETGQLVTYE